MHCFISILVCNYLEEEEKAGCSVFIILHLSCYCNCSMALPGLQCVIVIFPDHTHEHFGCLTLIVFLVLCSCY